MRYRAAIFDMDGTILDTLNDLADAMNHVLQTEGYPVRTVDEIRMFVGNGLKKLAERALPKDTEEAEVDRIFNILNDYYRAHCSIKTGPYDGICRALQELKKAGIKTAVVSNKPDAAVKVLAEEYFPGLFDVAIGEKAGVNKKPAPDEVNIALEALEIRRNEAVYIGDSDVDLMTAINSGLYCIGVSWGFRGREFLEAHGAECVVDSPLDIIPILLN